MTRVNGRGGGVIIFAKNGLVTELVNTPFIEGTLESVGIKIGNTVVINIYRPPNGNKQIFLQEFESMLDMFKLNDIVVTGDFNINFLNLANEIVNICNQLGVKIKIKGITRPASGTCLDNYITNLEGIFSITNICIADHLAIKAKIRINGKLKKLKPTHKYRVMKEINWLLFKGKMFDTVIAGSSIEEKWNNISANVKMAIETSFPEQTSRHEYKFSMSRGLMKSRDKKNKLLREFKLGKINKEIYINYNKVYRKLIQLEQEKSFKNKMVDAGNCGKKKWRVLKKELLLEKENKSIDSITVNDSKITNKNRIAEEFKKHFETCAASLADNLPPPKDTSNIMQQGNTWSFKTIAESDLVKIIGSLKSKNSSGSDLLSNRMIKAEKYAFAKLLKPLINESIQQGVFPDCLKSAIVIPIFKKGSTDNLNNYRPISLLPVMSKIFEKVLNGQLTEIIENGYIDDNQFGFRKAHSTEDALIKFADRVQKELAANKHVVSVFVDVSKAFDSCDHGILITKIKKTGLNELGIKLLESYLKDRKQNVFVNGVNGGSFVINIGVGQGTILGPTFFKIYIMDLHLHTSLFTVKFADDSSFIGSGMSRDAVQAIVNTELEKISEWFKSNRLTLHPSKSKFLVHSRDKLVEIKISNVILQRSGYGLQEESVKLLGIEIDENLDWKGKFRQ
jgi:ribosomal protein L30/L7E